MPYGVCCHLRGPIHPPLTALTLDVIFWASSSGGEAPEA